MRWYEENSKLTELLNFVKTLDKEDCETVANHLLQILITECNVNLDKELSNAFNSEHPYKRWYDRNLDLSASMEILKNIPKEEQDYVVERFLSEIILSYAKKEL